MSTQDVVTWSEDEYFRNAMKTLSTHFYMGREHPVSGEVFRGTVKAMLEAAGELDGVKKAVYYGKPPKAVDSTVPDVSAAALKCQKDLLHHAIGLCTESVELLRVALEYSSRLISECPDDQALRFIDEMGDIEWYRAGVYTELHRLAGITPSKVQQGNIAKLAARYPKGTFSSSDVINKDEAKEAAALAGELSRE